MGTKVVSSLHRTSPHVSTHTILTVLIVTASALVTAGCASMQVHLGMKMILSKIPVSSIEVRQAMGPGIGPGQKSSLIVTITEPNGKTLQTEWLPARRPIRVVVSSGASCPDALVEAVIRKIAGYYDATERVESLVESFAS